jgi:hypothetical protein
MKTTEKMLIDRNLANKLEKLGARVQNTKYTIVLTNDYHPTATMTLEDSRDFEKAPSKKQINEWLEDIDAEFNFPYDYYNINKL